MYFNVKKLKTKINITYKVITIKKIYINFLFNDNVKCKSDIVLS